MQSAKIKTIIPRKNFFEIQRGRQNSKLNKKVILFGLILAFSFAVFVVFSFARGRLAERGRLANRSGKFADLAGKCTPTPSVTNPPTPTPTLSPEQIAEIERKKFNDLNAKYGPCKRVPILMYHHVLPSSVAKTIGATNLNVAPETFRQQMDYLIGKGYTVLGLDQLLSMIAGNSLPSKPAVLTFDDGYRDFYDYVYPILREKNIKATVFVISQFVGGERYLVWTQVKEMSDSGLVLIGDHTLNHVNLPKLGVDQEKNQIISAKQITEGNIGKPVNYFAYPYGAANQNAKTILKENGFLGAVTTVIGNTQCAGLPYDLHRIRIGSGNLSRYGL